MHARYLLQDEVNHAPVSIICLIYTDCKGSEGIGDYFLCMCLHWRLLTPPEEFQPYCYSSRVFLNREQTIGICQPQQAAYVKDFARLKFLKSAAHLPIAPSEIPETSIKEGLENSSSGGRSQRDLANLPCYLLTGRSRTITACTCNHPHVYH